VFGPWQLITGIHSSNGNLLPGNYEDPFFFIDARGNMHVLYHVYRTGGAEAHNCAPGHDGSIVSGHFFSKDGSAFASCDVVGGIKTKSRNIAESSKILSFVCSTECIATIFD
jgi:hypothetical protein